MPTAIEKRLADLEELIHPGARQRAAVVQQTAAERAALMADFAKATDRRRQAEAAHPAAVAELRRSIMAAVAARQKLAGIETSIEDAVARQRDIAAHGLEVEISTFVPRVTTQDFSFLLTGIDEQVREISRRSVA